MARRKRHEAEIERSRLLILDAAARVFVRNGFQAASMAAIAKEAGYTAPTLYTYFDGKADIFNALGENVVTSVCSVYDDHWPAGMTYEQRLELLVLRLFKSIDALRDAFAFFITLHTPSEALPQGASSLKQRFSPDLTQRSIEWHRDNLPNSRYSEIAPELVVLFIQGVIKSFAENWISQAEERPFVEEVSTVVPLILGGLEGLVQSRERTID